jgi:hypothetical protein
VSNSQLAKPFRSTQNTFYAGRAAAMLQKQRRICRTNSLKFIAPLFRATSSCGSSSTAGSQERTARAPSMPPSWSSAKLKVTRNIATESRRVLECRQGHGLWCCDPFRPSILPTFVDIIILHVHTEEELPLGLTLVNLREDHAQLAPPCSNANTSDIPLQCRGMAERAVVHGSAAWPMHTIRSTAARP